MKKSFRNRLLKSTTIVLLLALLVLPLFGCQDDENKEPDVPAVVEPPIVMDWLYTDGTDIVTDKGVTPLRGINAGGLFVHESWMCPVSSVDYVTTVATLNSRFGEEKADALLATYRKNWWTPQDFKNVKALGYNLIRLPFGYFNVERNGVYDFSEIDAFVNSCRENSLYCMLDLHGAYGSQNGKDHSGDTSQCNLFESEENMAKTVALWEALATRYKDDPTVAGYDLLNEPEGKNGNTEYLQWSFYERLYRAIRAIDSKHIILIESVWEARNLPGLSLFNWENVVYEFHNYSWGKDTLEEQSLFIDEKIKSYDEANFGCPIFIGEFNCFDNLDCWRYTLSKYNEKGYSWTVWTYKVTAEKSSWGNYLKECEKADVANDSYDEIERKWSVGLEGFKENSTFTSVITAFLGFQ